MGRMVYVRSKKKLGVDGHWSEKQRLNAAAVFLETGNLVTTSDICKIPFETIRRWKRADWWIDAIKFMQEQQDSERDGKYSTVISSAIAAIHDRLEKGDYILDSKTGNVIRVPVKLRDAGRILKDSVDLQNNIRHRPAQMKEQAGVEDRLNKLAEAFTKFTNKVESVLPKNLTEDELEDITDVEYVVEPS